MKKIISGTLMAQGEQGRGQFEFASLNEKTGHLYIRNTPLQASVRSDSMSLKNGYYKIVEGVLYIRAKRMFYETVERFGEKLDHWNLDSFVYLIEQEALDALENPPVLKDITIKRWLRKNKHIVGYEVPYTSPWNEDNPEVKNMKWFKCKQELPIEWASSQFVLMEKDPE